MSGIPDERLAAQRFIQLPILVLNDSRLSDTAVRAYGIMLDASREGRCVISERRLGQRLRRSEDTARRIIRKLVDAGWLETIDHGNGKCRAYWLLTPSTRARGSDAQTPGAHARGRDANPLHPCHPTPSTGATHSIRNSINVRTSAKKDGNDEGNETHRTLVALIERCGFNGQAENEASRVSRQLPAAGDKKRLIGWLRYALDATGINSPLAFAISRTRQGEDPPRPPASPYPFVRVDADGNLVSTPARTPA